MCQKETFLSSRAFNVSALLNKIAEIVGDQHLLGEVVTSTLELSAVTNLKAFDGPMKKPGERNRDTSNYSFNGKRYSKKTEFVHDVVAFYVKEHPTTTHEQLKDVFGFKKNMDKVFMDYDCYLQLLSEKGSVDFFGRKPDIPIIQLADKKIVISTNWPTIVNGKPAEFSKLLELLKTKLKYVVENR